MFKSMRNVVLVALAVLVSMAAVSWVAAQDDEAKAGFLGVRLTDEEDSVVIGMIVPESAAEAAGLQEDDVITAVNGVEVSTSADVSELIGALAAGDAITLDITRGEEALTIEVTLGERPDEIVIERGPFRGGNRGEGRNFEMPDMQMIPGMGMFGQMFGNGRLGVTFATLDADVAAENEVTVTEGALVMEVAEDSPASSAGLLANDVITAVNGEAVDSERTLRDRLIAYEPDDVVTLTVLRGEETLDIEVTLGEYEMNGGAFMPFADGEFPEGLFRFELPMPGDGEGFHFFGTPDDAAEAPVGTNL